MQPAKERPDRQRRTCDFGGELLNGVVMPRLLTLAQQGLAWCPLHDSQRTAQRGAQAQLARLCAATEVKSSRKRLWRL